jgi:hypothetical protein
MMVRINRLDSFVIVECRLLKSCDFRVGWVWKTGDIFRENQPIFKVFFTKRLFDDGSEIDLLEGSCNRKFAADL